MGEPNENTKKGPDARNVYF